MSLGTFGSACGEVLLSLGGVIGLEEGVSFSREFCLLGEFLEEVFAEEVELRYS